MVPPRGPILGAIFWTQKWPDRVRHVTVRVALCPAIFGSRKWTRFGGRERAPRSDFCANVLAPVAEIGYRTVRERGHCHAEAERPPSFLSARLQTCKSDRCYRDAYRNNTSNVDRGSARLKRRRNVHWFRVSFSLHAHLVGTMDNRLGGAIHPLVFPLCVFLFVKYVFCRFLVCMPVAFRSTCDRLNASVKPLYTSRSLCVSQTSSRRPQPEHVDCNGAEKKGLRYNSSAMDSAQNGLAAMANAPLRTITRSVSSKCATSGKEIRAVCRFGITWNGELVAVGPSCGEKKSAVACARWRR